MAKYIKQDCVGKLMEDFNIWLSEECQMGLGEVGELIDEMEELEDNQTYYILPAESTKSGQEVKVDLDPEYFIE